MQEGYDSLTKKTLSFLRAAVATWDAEYIVKVIAKSTSAAGTCSQQTKFMLVRSVRAPFMYLWACRWMMMCTCERST